MSIDNIQRLIDIHTRRLQKLKEQHASFGIEASPHILIEIEDIEAIIEELRAQLPEVGPGPVASPARGQGSRPVSPTPSNQGIMITGGTVSAGQITAGAGNQAFQVTFSGGDPSPQPRHLVAGAAIALLGALEEHAGKIEDAKEVVQLVQQVDEEAGKAQPNKRALRSTLEAIKDAVGSDAGLLRKATTLQSAVESLIGQLKP